MLDTRWMPRGRQGAVALTVGSVPCRIVPKLRRCHWFFIFNNQWKRCNLATILRGTDATVSAAVRRKWGTQLRRETRQQQRLQEGRPWWELDSQVAGRDHIEGRPWWELDSQAAGRDHRQGRPWWELDSQGAGRDHRQGDRKVIKL